MENFSTKKLNIDVKTEPEDDEAKKRKIDPKTEPEDDEAKKLKIDIKTEPEDDEARFANIPPIPISIVNFKVEKDDDYDVPTRPMPQPSSAFPWPIPRFAISSLNFKVEKNDDVPTRPMPQPSSAFPWRVNPEMSGYISSGCQCLMCEEYLTQPYMVTEEDFRFLELWNNTITSENLKSKYKVEEIPPTEQQPSTAPIDGSERQIAEDMKEEFAVKSNDIAPEDVKEEASISGTSMVGNSKEVCNIRIPACDTVDTVTPSDDSQEEGTTKFTCPVCCQEFLRKRYYDRHVATHSNTCLSCFKKFSSEYQLQQHKGEYTQYDKYICIVCLKSFLSKDFLVFHMSRHNPALKYRCSVCEERFTQHSDLKSHMNSHRGLTEYQCPVCSGFFRKVQSLKYHLSLHTGEKVYTCEYCPEKFVCFNDLFIHRAMSYGKNIHPTQLVCGLKSMFIRNLGRLPRVTSYPCNMPIP